MVMRPLPDFGLVPTVTVTVTRRVETGTDAFNAPVWEEETEEVAGVVARPSSTSDLGADRPEGTRAGATFAFPKSYSKPLKGCTVTWGGDDYCVVGDPRPVLADGAPDPWNYTVEGEMVDG